MARDHQLTKDEIDSLILHYQSELRKLQFQIVGVEDAINKLMRSASPVAAKPVETVVETAESKPEKADRRRKKAEKPAKAPRAAKAAKTPPPAEEPSTPAEPAPAEEAPNKRRPRITVKPPKPLAPVKEKGRRGRPKSTASAADVESVADAATEAPAKSEAPAEKGKRGRKPGQKVKAAKTEDDGKGKGYRLSAFDNYILEALNTRGHVLISSDLMSFIEAKYQENNESFTDEDLKTRLSRSLHKMVNRRGDIKQVKYSGRGHAYALPAWVGEDGETKAKFRRK